MRGWWPRRNDGSQLWATDRYICRYVRHSEDNKSPTLSVQVKPAVKE